MREGGSERARELYLKHGKSSVKLNCIVQYNFVIDSVECHLLAMKTTTFRNLFGVVINRSRPAICRIKQTE